MVITRSTNAMSATRHTSYAGSLLLTGTMCSSDDPRIFAMLFVDCLELRILPWTALERFHFSYRASPIDWPRSLAESRLMLTLAVRMANAFGEEPGCREVTRTLAYHLIDRAPHPSLVALVREATEGYSERLLTLHPE